MLRYFRIAINTICSLFSNPPPRRRLRGPNSQFPRNLNEDEDLTNRIQHLRVLKNSINREGGILTKFSQLLSMNESDDDVFHDVRPRLCNSTVSWFKKYWDNNENNITHYINHINFDNYKSGSIGIVFFAEDNTHTPIVIKVVYRGLNKTIASDYKMFKLLSSYLYPYKNDIRFVIEEIFETVKNESNIELEYINQQLMCELWKSSDIKIPALLEYSNKDFLAMEKIDGYSISDTVKSGLPINQRKYIAHQIVYFVFKNLFVYNKFYSDIHNGNILITSAGKACFLDFGCIHTNMPAETINFCKKILIALRNENYNDFIYWSKSFGIINDGVTSESICYLYKYLRNQMLPYICGHSFDCNQEWIRHALTSDIKLMNEWKIPPGSIYLIKIPHGLSWILSNLNAGEVDYYSIINEFIS